VSVLLLLLFGCLDDNECERVTCIDNSECQNKLGSYICECFDGYERRALTGGGVACEGENTHVGKMIMLMMSFVWLVVCLCRY